MVSKSKMPDAPKAKVRSIDFLSPDQLQRKREVDRKSQRQARERTRTYINELETKVRDFETRICGLEQEFSAFVERCTCKGESQEAARLTPAPDEWQNESRDQNGSREEHFQSIARNLDWIDRHDNHDLVQMINEDPTGLDLSLWQRVFDDTMLATSQGHPIQSTSITPSSIPPALEAAVWQALPRNTNPTCALDSVLTNLVQNRRAYEASGGNDQEFEKRVFPSIQSLLNPKSDSIKKTPVTSTIVNHIIHVIPVPTLPEQIAILYIMSSMVRWQISPTEANYDNIPAWLRPTPSQLFNPHPAWIDVLVWPKIRERMSRQEKYHKEYPAMSKICHETMSINWPHRASDMILQIGDDIILNPIFERHIQNIENWTVGSRILEIFPDFVDELKIGPPRGSNPRTT